MNLQFFTYNLPFKNAFHTAAKSFSSRQGMVIELQKDGLRSLGEIAPLPGFSKETLEDAKKQLQEAKPLITEFLKSSFNLKSVLNFLESQDFYPSLEFGLFTLVVFYVAQKENCSACQLLFDDSQVKIPVNAVLGLETANYEQKIQKYLSHGYTTIKVKVDKNWPRHFSIINQIRRNHPEIAIRIDANKSWPLDEGIYNLKQAEDLNIEYCEEPLARLDEKSLQALQESCEIPIALDESLCQTFTLTKAVNLAPVLIIKPMVLGQSCMSHGFLEQAKAHHTKLIFTTSLESGIGRLMTATLAAGLGSPEMAHGLGTGSMLKNDIWKDEPFLQNAHFNLPDTKRLSTLMQTSFSHLNLTKL